MVAQDATVALGAERLDLADDFLCRHVLIVSCFRIA
jgi:hypothetical protein